MYIYELKRGDLFKIGDSEILQYHGMDGMYAKVTFGAREWDAMSFQSLNLSGGTEVCKFEESKNGL